MKDCYHCSGKHSASFYHFKHAICHFCKKPGHIARACLVKAKLSPGQEAVEKPKPHTRCTHCIHADGEPEDVYKLFHVSERNIVPYQVKLFVNDTPLSMEVDTGAAVSLISEATYRSMGDLWLQLNPTTVYICTYSGEQPEVLGSLEVAVKYGNQKADLTLLMAKGFGPSLLGRDWLSAIRLDWKSLTIHRAKEHSLEGILDYYKTCFGRNWD